MIDFIRAGLLLSAGVCVYAGFHHLALGWRQPREYPHLLFAGMCLLMVPFALANIVSAQATDGESYISAVRVSIAVALIVHLMYVWFIALYTGMRPLLLLLPLSAMLILLLVVNLLQPFTVQYARFDGLRQLILPWGEVISLGAGNSGLWAQVTVASVLVSFGFMLFALGERYHRYRRTESLWMIAGVVCYLVASGHGMLVRLSVLDFAPMGPFGFISMVLLMSVASGRETRRRQRQSELQFRSLVEQSPFSLQLMDSDGNIEMVNPAWERLWGRYSSRLVRQYNLLKDRQLVERGVMPYMKRGFSGEAVDIPPFLYNPAHTMDTAVDRDYWVRGNIYPIRNEEGDISQVVLVHEDVTDRKRVEDAIRLIAAGVSGETGEPVFRQLVQRLAELFDADLAYIGEVDAEDPQQINTLALCQGGAGEPNVSFRLPGTPDARVLSDGICVFSDRVQRYFPRDSRLIGSQMTGFIGAPLFGIDGRAMGLIVLQNSEPLADTDQVREIVEIFATRASTELQRLLAEQHIRRMAYEDYLTGLANRACLLERIRELLKGSRSDRIIGALFLIDLDHFKTINDALSHDIGDEVLCSVSRRITQFVADDGLVARMGGDEFIILAPMFESDCQEAESVAGVRAQEILDNLSAPLVVGDQAFNIGASMGVVLITGGNESELDLIRQADMALYRAKHLGRGNIQFYTPDLQDAAATRLQLESGLRRAVEAGEFELHFQPQVDQHGHVVGAEALLRWHHPELGNVPPDVFIPVAEETGLIHHIGRWVLEEACGKLMSWTQVVDTSFHLAVNVCPWQFARADFMDQLHDVIREHGVPAGRLMLELTETVLLNDLDDGIRKLGMLRESGIAVALDDFGTGYSSLAHLRDLPLDQIKIDRAFVSELDGEAHHPMVESMLSIGEHMQLEVVAEGVETEVQREVLVRLGCRRFQGYLFSLPMKESDFIDWLDRNLSTRLATLSD